MYHTILSIRKVNHHPDLGMVELLRNPPFYYLADQPTTSSSLTGDPVEMGKSHIDVADLNVLLAQNSSSYGSDTLYKIRSCLWCVPDDLTEAHEQIWRAQRYVEPAMLKS